MTPDQENKIILHALNMLEMSVVRNRTAIKETIIEQNNREKLEQNAELKIGEFLDAISHTIKKYEKLQEQKIVSK